MMPTNDVIAMIWQALRAMAIGIPGVFAVLAVFYGALRLMTAGAYKNDGGKDE
jgi:hypothetical protein